MKYFSLTLLILVICLENGLSQNATATANLSRKVLVTLQPEEGILEAESCFPLAVDGNQFYLVTSLDNKFFIYENGQRKGPFEDLETAGYKPCEDNLADNECNAYTTEESGMNRELLTVSDDGKYLIKFNNKTYGPFMYFRDIYVWPDKSGFVAIAVDAGMKSYLVTSEGQNAVLEGDAESLHISPSGENYVFAVKENPNLNPSLLSMDFSKMTTEELMKFAKEQEEKAKSAGPPKAWVYVSNGPKIGPFGAQGFYFNSLTYTKTGGDNWIMRVDNVLYINGIEKKKFDDIDLNSCKIWVSKDGKRYAVATWDKIAFYDGSIYPYPIKIAGLEKDGKNLMKWVSLENEKDLVLYSREL